MPQPDHVSALPLAPEESLPDDLQQYFDKCREKLGMVPNVLQAYSLRPRKLSTFINSYNELMLGDSALSKLEREMIAVVVSSANRCFYCLVAHGQAVRALSGDPELGELLVMNYRAADLSLRHRAMLDFAWALTIDPAGIGEANRQTLRDVGFTDEAIFDIADVTGFFNMTNRVASGIDMMPNKDYHAMDRELQGAGSATDGLGTGKLPKRS